MTDAICDLCLENPVRATNELLCTTCDEKVQRLRKLNRLSEVLKQPTAKEFERIAKSDNPVQMYLTEKVVSAAWEVYHWLSRDGESYDHSKHLPENAPMLHLEDALYELFDLENGEPNTTIVDFIQKLDVGVAAEIRMRERCVKVVEEAADRRNQAFLNDPSLTGVGLNAVALRGVQHELERLPLELDVKGTYTEKMTWEQWVEQYHSKFIRCDKCGCEEPGHYDHCPNEKVSV